jgi:hypothetical protein
VVSAGTLRANIYIRDKDLGYKSFIMINFLRFDDTKLIILSRQASAGVRASGGNRNKNKKKKLILCNYTAKYSVLLIRS